MSSKSKLPVLDLPNGLKLHLASATDLRSARFVAWEVFQKKIYEHPGFDLHESDVVVDIGANVGVFALWAAPQVPQGRVICVEPSRAIDCLELSLEPNNLTHVRILRHAIGRSEGSVELVDYPGQRVINHSAEFPLPRIQRIIRWIFQQPSCPPQKIVYPCRSLDEVFSDAQLQRIHFLKVDCEGGEFEMFEHCSNEALQRVDRMVVEFHEYLAAHDHRHMVKRLVANGFTVQVLKPWIEYNLFRTGIIWAHKTKP
jgi:FkbM family methyltransferase